MSDNFHQAPSTSSLRGEYQRVRLSEWARREGISRITAYRMLRKGVLPVPFERSPTGRWYVLLPAEKIGRLAVYARGTPGPMRITEINEQMAGLSEWVADRHLSVFTVVHEIGDPELEDLPRLEALLSDRQITHILIERAGVIGPGFRLLVAALAPQGRSIIIADGGGQRSARR